MLKIKLVDLMTIVPTKAHEGDAGWDVYSRENYELLPGEVHHFKLGFHIQGERGKMYEVQARSGLAKNHGINTIGNIIDNTYTGEVSAILHNTSSNTKIFKINDKIAQIVIVNIDDDNKIELVDEIKETHRGENGYGSTGI